ncbi:MAG: replicative DNA helicase [Oscillospiraceae bacterium]|nr:replicative DNA helicase [Candidatus Equicaccousia limihippi]
MAENDILSLDGARAPFSVEAEQSVIGAVLIDPTAMNYTENVLNADWFYLPQHKVIYSTLSEMYSTNRPIDFVTLFETLKKNGKLEEAGDKAYLMQIVDTVPSAANIENYVEIVKERHFARALLTAAQTITTEVNAGGDANEHIDHAEQLIYDIRKGRDVTDLVPIKKIIQEETYVRLQKLADPETRSEYYGVNCGFAEIDETLSGFQKGNLIILGARPGVGKTSMALNMARHMAVKEKKTVCFFSLEMSRDEIAQRLISNEASIESMHLRDSMKMQDDEWIRLAQASDILSNAKLYVDETPNLTVNKVKAKLRRIKDVDIAIIDYLGLLSPVKSRENRTQDVSEISRALKTMAKELGIPVLACAQLNRGSQAKGTNQRPTLVDLRDSGSIEQDADVVMFLHKPEQNDDQEFNPTVELIVAKNRHGNTPTIKLNFDGKYTRFTVQEHRFDE